MRTLLPADSLVYLETNDLAAAIQPIVDSKPFTETAKRKPDLSALKGVQLAIAVTGFETSEEKLTDEHSIGRVQPHFVAIADTHAWNFQAVAFAEQKLGSFVENIYNSEPTLEKSEKSGGKYFTWTAKDGRKAFALVIDSLIYFGNDESIIEKCQAVKRGESDSIVKTGKLPISSQETLAFGYVSPDGIAQIANIAGLKIASEAGEDSEVQSAIAAILPQVVRGSVVDVSWKAIKTSYGLQDDVSVSLKPEIAKVFKETIRQSSFQGTDFEEFVPTSAASVTRYILDDPRTAWRSVLLSTQAQTDPISGKMIGLMSKTLFEPYGIVDPELFLSSVADHRILTVRLDQEGDEIVVITRANDINQLKRSITTEIDFSKAGETVGEASVWRSGDGSMTAALLNDVAMVGNSNGVEKCLEAKRTGKDFTKRERFKQFEITNAPVVTIAKQVEPSAALVNFFSETREDTSPILQTSFTGTYFDDSGMHRVTLSDVGLIGSIISQLDDDR